MATTIPRQFPAPLSHSVRAAYATAQEGYVTALGDLDKTTYEEDASYYAGRVDAFVAILESLTGRTYSDSLPDLDGWPS